MKITKMQINIQKSIKLKCNAKKDAAIDEQIYTKIGDYLIPDLVMDGKDDAPHGKYGMLRETFLQKRHHGTYTSMLLTGRLEPHLREIDQQAQEQVEQIVGSPKRLNGVDERMKADNQMAWVRAVSSFTAQAEELVLPEIVYR